jgi:hypothetical protein
MQDIAQVAFSDDGITFVFVDGTIKTHALSEELRMVYQDILKDWGDELAPEVANTSDEPETPEQDY